MQGTMKRSPSSKPNAPAPPTDAALSVGDSRLSERPGWDELLRTLSPSSPLPEPASEAGQSRSQQASPAQSPTAADSRRRNKAQHSREATATPHRGHLAILLPQEAQLFAADTPFVERKTSGKQWLAVVPLGQPSDREHAAALDFAMCDAISSGTEAAARALMFRSEAAQRCSADAQQRLADKLRHIVEGDLCPALPSGLDESADAVGLLPSSAASDGTSGGSGSSAFWEASASLALAVFMADLVAQVEGHCAERGWALARLWNAHIAIAAQTSRAQREMLEQLQVAHAAQEAHLLSARAEAAAVQRLRKQLAIQSQAADGLRVELRDLTHDYNTLRQQLIQAQSDAATTDTRAAAAHEPAIPSQDAAKVQIVQS